jgi:hypothetical protein
MLLSEYAGAARGHAIGSRISDNFGTTIFSVKRGAFERPIEIQKYQLVRVLALEDA